MSASTLAARGRRAWPPGLCTAWGSAARTSVNRSGRRGFGAALALLWVLGAGCAMRPNVLPAPAAPPSSSHTEVAELEKAIAEHKASLRGGGEKQAAGTSTTAEAPSSMAADAGPVSRCDGVCRAGQEICTASRRICKIAIELTDSSITASCQRAERECNDASALCAQCK